jgi:hypothetical protein
MPSPFKCSPIAMLVVALGVLSVSAQSGDYIRAEVSGQFSEAGGAGGEHTGFQIKADGLTWEVDPSADEKLLQTAERLAGKISIVTGTYTERRGASRLRRILTAQTLLPATEGARREYIDVIVHGTLRTGIIAIGAETTGATITAGAVTWELELDANQQAVARKLSGSKATISGQLRQQAGVEVRYRSIVKVRSIE